MLQPTNRLTLIDAMRPPVCFRFESAMAVTFTLDLRALVAAPAAFALAETVDTANGESQYEPVELLHALRSHASKLTVFSQAGEIALPTSRQVFAFLEQAVVPVTAPKGGVVHPKVWVLRYESAGGSPDSRPREQRLRVLVASRNLTFDTSWDTLVRLDETPDGAGARLEPVSDLFEGLLAGAVGTVPADHRNRVRSLSVALRTARFALPEGVDDVRIHVLGLTPTPLPLPATAERSLIISPFVSDDFLLTVHPMRIGELVSRPESLDLLELDALKKVDTVYAFDDGSAPDIVAEEDRLSPEDPGRPLAGLHAKIFAFEDEGRARLFLGSANATGAAFNSNVEILVELAGPPSVLGIDRLCGGLDDERGLRDLLFNEYHRSDLVEHPEESSTLDGARRTIAQLQFDGLVEESGTDWAVTYRSRQPMPLFDGTQIHCWPLASPGHRRRIAGDEPLGARFETSLEALSGFLAFELSHEDGSQTGFVVPVALVGVPEHRERFLLRHLIGKPERFLRYLLALLDEDSTRMDLLDAVERVTTSPRGNGGGEYAVPVLERLLRTMRRDPDKLAGLHPLVLDLDDAEVLPPGFAELWATIHGVAIAGPAR